jgi:hypothetical protein
MEYSIDMLREVGNDAGLSWSARSMLNLACEFIDETDNAEAFREYARAQADSEKAEGSSIEAECHADDYVFTAKFNAVPWFKQAFDSEILKLAACDWGGDYPADAVAHFMSDIDSDIADMFGYLGKKDVGFECHVDADPAMAWLGDFKTNLWKFILWAQEQEDPLYVLGDAAEELKEDDLPAMCECDNTHQEKDTVCLWCLCHGRSKWADPEVKEDV